MRRLWLLVRVGPGPGLLAAVAHAEGVHGPGALADLSQPIRHGLGRDLARGIRGFVGIEPKRLVSREGR